jgi:arylsulfatase A-like enzyme
MISLIAWFIWFNSRGVVAEEVSQPALSGEMERPNVVIIVIDTTRADRFAAAQTPNLDAWAQQGAVFKAATAPMPLTGPSHASLFTAKYPRSHGLLTNGWILADLEVTLAEILGQHGYTTAAFISAFVLNAGASGMQQGFQTYDDNLAPLGRYASLTVMRLTNFLLGGSLKERRADATTRRVLAWIGPTAPQPFFLWVHYFDPHSPYDPPPPYDRLYEPADQSETARMLARYDGEITFTDAQAGHLLNQLAAAGLMDNTILVVTADHGESFGEQQGYFGHGEYLYEPATHVPLILYYPPAIKAGTVVESTVQVLDITPTILDLLDIPRPAGQQGATLLPLLATEDFSRQAFSQVFPGEASLERYALKQHRWKYIYTPDQELAELYNLQSDPQEQNNLAVETPTLRQKMAGYLNQWLEKTPLIFAEQTIDAETQEMLEELGY